MKTARHKKPDALNNNTLTSEQTATFIDMIKNMTSKGLTQCASEEELSSYKYLASCLLEYQQQIIHIFTNSNEDLLVGQNRNVLEIINTYANEDARKAVEKIEKGVDALRSSSNASHSFFRPSQDEPEILRKLEELANLYTLIENNSQSLSNFISMVGNDRGGPKI